MAIRAFFGLLAIAFPAALVTKIIIARRRLGRSPVVLGRAAGGQWARRFERAGPLALAAWPLLWLCVAAGGVPVSGGTGCDVGIMLMAAGALLSLLSLFLMGGAWRIGIDPDNRTDLADRGPYRWVRHPIYSGFLLLVVGNVMAVPHPAVDAAALLTAAGVAWQAYREERHLQGIFGDRYVRYVARTGAFVPRLWRGGRAR